MAERQGCNAAFITGILAPLEFQKVVCCHFKISTFLKKLKIKLDQQGKTVRKGPFLNSKGLVGGSSPDLGTYMSLLR